MFLEERITDIYLIVYIVSFDSSQKVRCILNRKLDSYLMAGIIESNNLTPET